MVARKNVCQAAPGRVFCLNFWLKSEHSNKQFWIFRQENNLDISLVKFPNTQFQLSHDFVKIVKKLFWSCYPNTTRFGYRRWRMDLAYPQLCPFYDKYFYNNTIISNMLVEGMKYLIFRLGLFENFWKLFLHDA